MVKSSADTKFMLVYAAEDLVTLVSDGLLGLGPDTTNSDSGADLFINTLFNAGVID